ncbi:hypothetical protein PM10SUCC1_32680 [Propionigenium maris DSM 9537]|uniref:Rad52/22 family double-strand break repair protein n=1 Tax=Propionigenium maris DSM 9537 TaxID=1123000 RepID=A0A9W6LP91_9FUSO|nr:Rad52/Rad22 family DNA repair protein [Propionigenium maris]GLI57754.1 hypothetical protein PM10SUCC1_32680 [Propionigenium maris DSM 9537]
MMTQNKLQAVFDKEELEFKVQASGESNGKYWVQVATYVQARAIQERLDNCFGFDGWSVAYRETPSGVLCRLKAIYDGREIIKEDGAELTGKIGEPNALKGGCSGALKRVASSGFGIGRYLYKLPKMYAEEVQKDKPKDTIGWHKSKMKGGQWMWWKEPTLPYWAYTNECDKQATTTTTTEAQKKSQPPTTTHDTSEMTLDKASHLKWPIGKLKGTALGIVYKNSPDQIKYFYGYAHEGKFEDIKAAIKILDEATPENKRWKARVS